MPNSELPAQQIVVVGSGGNIGSHLVPHLGRLPGLKRIGLIDPDSYEEHNLASQAICPGDIGRKKVQVQAQLLQSLNPFLQVWALPERVEDVPLGQLRCQLLLSCLDSRLSRCWVNEAAVRLGIPWIDAGVQGEGLLARINVYPGSPDAPCLECPWDEEDYANLGVRYRCLENTPGNVPRAAPTHAPSSLGALAASLQALECQKLLAGSGEVSYSRQVLVDARHHRHFVTELTRNLRCRFDHRKWQITQLQVAPQELTLGDALALPGELPGESSRESASRLEVEKHPFVTALCCPSCGHQRPMLRLLKRITPSQRACPHDACGGELVPVPALHLEDELVL
ncbi:MAG: ThiF family adenylyltransferase, partial [Planctomycetota bacterium]